MVACQLGFFRVAEQGAEKAVGSADADDMGWRLAGGLLSYGEADDVIR